jgi:hypothetical protein
VEERRSRMDNAGKRVSVQLLLLLAAVVVLAVAAVLLFVMVELVMLLMVIKILSLETDGCGANRASGVEGGGAAMAVLVYGSRTNLRDPSSLLFCSNVCRQTNSIHTIV